MEVGQFTRWQCEKIVWDFSLNSLPPKKCRAFVMLSMSSSFHQTEQPDTLWHGIMKGLGTSPQVWINITRPNSKILCHFSMARRGRSGHSGLSSLDILGIKTGRGNWPHNKRTEGRNTFILFPQVEVEWISRKKGSYADTGKDVLCTLVYSFGLYT